MSLEELEGSPAYEIFNEVSRRKAAGEDVVSLAIGEPSFATPPEIIEAAYQSMKSGDPPRRFLWDTRAEGRDFPEG